MRNTCAICGADGESHVVYLCPQHASLGSEPDWLDGWSADVIRKSADLAEKRMAERLRQTGKVTTTNK